MSLSEEIREAGDWQGYSKMLAPVTLKGFADRVAELEKENALLLKADKVAELEQQVASLEEQLAVYISSEANEYGQSQQLIAKLQKQVASLEDANALLLKDEKASPAIIAGYRFRGEQLIEENESLRDRLAKVNENKYVWYQKGYDYGMRVGNDQQLNESECDIVALADELSGTKMRIECYEEENAKLKERIAKLEQQLDKLKRMEFICSRCGIRKDGESEGGDF